MKSYNQIKRKNERFYLSSLVNKYYGNILTEFGLEKTTKFLKI